ncbi:MAG TPA: hypothetical protein VNI55_10145 [Gaiellaceae bacterium]|nr:hypothetical protein [Gaiellaceae bacterium]
MRRHPGVAPELSREERIAAARVPTWPSWAAFEAEARPECRRWTPELAAIFRAGLEERSDGSLASRWTPETRGSVMHELVAKPVSRVWPAVAASAVPTLLLAATEPTATRELNELHVPRFAAAVPTAEIRWIEGGGHDLFADAGPRVAGEVVAWLDGLPDR